MNGFRGLHPIIDHEVIFMLNNIDIEYNIDWSITLSTRYCDPMLFLTEVFNARGVECIINIYTDDLQV